MHNDTLADSSDENLNVDAYKKVHNGTAFAATVNLLKMSPLVDLYRRPHNVANAKTLSNRQNNNGRTRREEKTETGSRAATEQVSGNTIAYINRVSLERLNSRKTSNGWQYGQASGCQYQRPDLFDCSDDKENDNLDEIIHDVMTKTSETEQLERESRNVDLLIISHGADAVTSCTCHRGTVSKSVAITTRHRAVVSKKSPNNGDCLCSFCSRNRGSHPSPKTVGRQTDDSWLTAKRYPDIDAASKTPSSSTRGTAVVFENKMVSPRQRVTSVDERSLIVNKWQH